MPADFYNDQEYRKRQSESTKKYWALGYYDSLRKPPVTRSCLNRSCAKAFQVKGHETKKYCGSSCAAYINNLQRPRRTPQCLVCNNFTKRLVYKYCSLKCQSTHRYNQYIDRWKQGLETGVIGITTKTISAHLRRYLQNKYGDKCSVCGWNQKNPTTNVVPLEIDHVDGNADNNVEENLRLICPNCHSLSSNFRNLNKGHGRAWRLKYLQTAR